MSLQTKGVILAIISAICYGMNPLGALFLYEEGLNVNSVIFYRFIFASILLAIFMIIKKDSFYLKFKEIILLALLGLLFGISAISLFNSFLYMDAGLASTVLFIYPIFVAIIMALFFKEKNSIITILSIVFAFLGVVLLYESDGANVSNFGIFLVIVSSLCYAIYIVIINQYLKMSALKVTFYSMLFCTITILIHSFFDSSLNIMPLVNFNMWFYTIFLALVPTIISLLFLIKAIQLIGSTSASILGALEPLTAVLIGVYVFNEKITFWLVIGIVFILFGVILIVLKDYIDKLFKIKN
ncbi:DMT family transporter [Aliarcobacter cryaerophilus]|uniref:DMT family transporter n=2 Tax=Arcobacteraceae TaxID=2808963 RepID=A0AAU0P3T6_9BACT|nr:DMT family transporter [Aliarcobacter cryaerophilus]WNL16360.1 DMT family transporter [Arcobacter sp. AZ-2023]WPD03470.1 DMT family transporter [Arcobacter sp. DSM 115972]MCT7444890.1 DMT family transporter [Aliarcobacter cryaerophilus]MCT7479497.1 DMT family transporter [Aliarcobacter cryaerophilus]MCT7534584.1 DMT family transporter [Aliarcobacter cryaerophilus]